MVKALYRKQPKGMDDMDWKDLEAKAEATIRLCLELGKFERKHEGKKIKEKN